MAISKEKLIALIKSKKMDAVQKVAQYIASDQTVADTLISIRKPSAVGLTSLSRFFVSVAKELVGEDDVEEVASIHVAALQLADDAVRRNSSTKTYLIQLWLRIMETASYNQFIRELYPYSKHLDPATKLKLIEWLYKEEAWDLSARLAETIKPTEDEYYGAIYYAGIYYILNDNASLRSSYVGLQLLLNIPPAHDHHPSKDDYVREAIGEASKRIREEGAHGVIVKDELAIFRSAKNDDKYCDIPDCLGPSSLSLHERQSLVERIVDLEKTEDQTELQATKFGDAYNHLVVNVGFIVTDRPWVQGGQHRRRFCSIPLLIENKTVHPGRPHTEITLYQLLSDQTRLADLIQKFKERFGIKANGHKVYGVVVDSHSTYDMCMNCFEKTKQFYIGWRELLLGALEEAGFVIPKQQETSIFKFFNTDDSIVRAEQVEDSRHFSITIRFSSNSDYTNVVRHEHLKTTNPIDVSFSDRHLLLHGSEHWHGLWTNENKIPKTHQSEVSVENWTVISTNFSPVVNCDPYNYSYLGSVDLAQYGLWSRPLSPDSGSDSETSKTTQGMSKLRLKG